MMVSSRKNKDPQPFRCFSVAQRTKTKKESKESEYICETPEVKKQIGISRISSTIAAAAAAAVAGEGGNRGEERRGGRF